MPSQRPYSRRRAVTVTGAVALTMIALAPIYLVWLSIAGTGRDNPPGTSLGWKVEQLRGPYSGLAREAVNVLQRPVASDSLFCMILHVQDIKPSDSLLSTVVFVSPGRSMQEAIQAKVASGAYSISDAFELNFGNNLGASDVSLQIPVQDMLRDSAQYDQCSGYAVGRTWSGRADLPILGQPRRYPADDYELLTSVEIHSPEDSPQSLEDCCPLDLRVGSLNEDLRVELSRSPEDSFLPLWMRVQRTTRIEMYSYVLAFIPAGLMALLVAQLIRATGVSGGLRLHEVTFGVSAITLSILPSGRCSFRVQYAA